MKPHDEIRIQTYFDDELPEAERPEVEALLENDADARAYLQDLQVTSEALQKSDPDVPELDMAWQSLNQKIDRVAANESKLFRFPPVISAAAAVIVAGVIAWWAYGTAPRNDVRLTEHQEVELIETSIENASTVIYVDEESGWTVVWVEESVEDPVI